MIAKIFSSLENVIVSFEKKKNCYHILLLFVNRSRRIVREKKRFEDRILEDLLDQARETVV